MKNESIIFISSGLIEPKKYYSGLSKLNFYLNYGLLGLASELSNKYDNVRVYHGEYQGPHAFLEQSGILTRIRSEIPLFLSIPSFYALPWAQQIVSIVKKFIPNSKVIIGGRWVTNGNTQWIKRKIDQADLIVEGLADGTTSHLLYPDRWPLITAKPVSVLAATKGACLTTLDYKLLEGYAEIPPSIEISRGCGAGCEFCAEGTVERSIVKCTDAIFDEIDKYLILTGNLSAPFYFEASNFLPSKKWIDAFKKRYCEGGYTFTWRAEVRADAFASVDIQSLARCGLKIIDIGLESGSSQQLLSMNKTVDPVSYLKQGQILLKKCFDSGVWAKTNILLYPGETAKTVDQTICWLKNNERFIKGVSAWPVTIFGCGDGAKRFVAGLSRYGACPVSETSYGETGITQLNLSKEIDYESSVETSITISKMFMSPRDYYDIKKHGYYKLGVDYQKFLSVVSSAEAKYLPFDVDNLYD